MSDGHTPQRDEAGNDEAGNDEAGNKDWNITLFDLLSSVPDRALEDAPCLKGGSSRRYLDYRALEGGDIIDFLRTGDIPVGAHDFKTADWAAHHLDLATLLTLLSWVRRAAANGCR